MLKIITLRNYNIIKMKDKNEYDHVTIVEVIRETEEEKNLPIPDKIIIPKISSIGDYTNFKNKYNIVLIIDDELGLNGSNDPVTTVLGFPVPKNIGQVNSNTIESSDIKQHLDNSAIDEEYKILSSDDGNSYVAVSNNSVVLKSGNNRFVIGNEQISSMGKMVDYNLPANNHGIVKESEILRLLPKCFVPPFSLPDYLPNVDLVLQVSKLAKVIKEMGDII